MSIYVVDCNVFSQALRNLSLDVFRDDIYTPWSDGMNSGKIISVDEVCRELDKYWGVTVQKEKRKKEGAWLAQHKSAFQPLTDEEGVILAGIFMNPKFREGIKEKSLREGSPEADAILVAKAKCVDGIVVTAESNDKPNAEKVPNMCVDLNVPYILIDDFYRMLRNISSEKPELEGVHVWDSLLS